MTTPAYIVRRVVRRLILSTLGAVAALLTATLFYFVAAALLMLIPRHADFTPTPTGVEVMVSTNGMHTDITLPVLAAGIDWRTWIPVSDFETLAPTHISLSWGDKAFFLHTPRREDATVGRVLKALFVPTDTAMHVYYWPHARRLRPERTRTLRLSHDQYLALVTAIRESFVTAEGHPVLIEGHGYGPRDRFYEAHGRYHVFFTCNDWTRDMLDAAGVTTGLWTPMDWGVMHHL